MSDGPTAVRLRPHPAALPGGDLHARATVGLVNRRTALLLTAAALPALLLAGCDDAPEEEAAPADAAGILEAAGLAAPGAGVSDGAPPIEATVEDGVLQGEEAWSRVVTFSGSAEQIEAWVEASFPGGIESKAFENDLAVAVERLGEGVQKKGDRLAEGIGPSSGTGGSTAFVVVVGQEAEPVVHAAVRRTGR